MTSSAIVQKLWNYCNILRDDGLSYLLARGLSASPAQAGAQASGDYPSAASLLSATEGLSRQEDGGSMAFSALGNG